MEIKLKFEMVKNPKKMKDKFTLRPFGVFNKIFIFLLVILCDGICLSKQVSLKFYLGKDTHTKLK